MAKWNLLRSKAAGLLATIETDWSDILNDASTTERDCLKFLGENAGLFFSPLPFYVAMSEIMLGSDYRIDFVIPQDQGSYGLAYELIEVESPHEPLFTKKGNPSARMVQAVQQLNDWKHWIQKNWGEAKRLFPSKEFVLWDRPSFRYTIIIGRRDNLNLNDNSRKRAQYAENQGVQIRTFDSLTENFQQNIFSDDTMLISAEEERLTKDTRNELSNPFFSALTHAEWKRFRQSKITESHMIASNARQLLEMRRYSKYFGQLQSEYSLDEW